jgi:hypothetical protein
MLVAHEILYGQMYEQYLIAMSIFAQGASVLIDSNYLWGIEPDASMLKPEKKTEPMIVLFSQMKGEELADATYPLAMRRF